MLYRKMVNNLREPRIKVRISSRMPGSTAYTTITGWAMIDTGTARTCIFEGIAKACRLEEGLPEQVYLANGSFHYSPTFYGSIEIPGIPSSRKIMRLGGMPERLGYLKGQSLICLLGTDFLQHCRFVYEGGSFSLDMRGH
ncbi:MAG: hypothetical protein F4X65_12910 [Chloroflexi bacterium]|nr:hypothetical protein [Chloroflexota bacterium]